VSQYKAAMNLGDDDSVPMTPAADTAWIIHSLAELTEFLAELPEAAGAATLDYDEAFFLENDLCAMPLDLSAQPDAAGEPAAAKETSSAAQMTTIPDETAVPYETIPDGTAHDTEPSTDACEAETTTEEPTSMAPAHTLPSGGLLLVSDVKVLLLVPVNKS